MHNSILLPTKIKVVEIRLDNAKIAESIKKHMLNKFFYWNDCGLPSYHHTIAILIILVKSNKNFATHEIHINLFILEHMKMYIACSNELWCILANSSKYFSEINLRHLNNIVWWRLNKWAIKFITTKLKTVAFIFQLFKSCTNLHAFSCSLFGLWRRLFLNKFFMWVWWIAGRYFYYGLNVFLLLLLSLWNEWYDASNVNYLNQLKR